jgi:hypothetical protein
MARYYLSFETIPNTWPDWVLYAHEEKPDGGAIVAEFDAPKFGSEQEKKDYIQSHYLPLGIVVGDSKDSAHERVLSSPPGRSSRGATSDVRTPNNPSEEVSHERRRTVPLQIVPNEAGQFRRALVSECDWRKT